MFNFSKKFKVFSLISFILIILIIVSYQIFMYLYFENCMFSYVATDVINIYSKTDGNVKKIKVMNGSHVKKGDKLIQLQSDKLQNELNMLQNQTRELIKQSQKYKKDFMETDLKFKLAKENCNNAKSMLELANNDYIRYKNDFSDGAVTDNDLDKATKNLTKATQSYNDSQNKLSDFQKKYAELQTKRNNISKEYNLNLSKIKKIKSQIMFLDIISPSDGTIINISVKEGMNITNDKILMTISPDEYYAMAILDENKNNFKIKNGQKVLIKIKGLNFKYVIAKVVNVKENHVTLKLNPNNKHILTSDMKISAKIKIK